MQAGTNYTCRQVLGYTCTQVHTRHDAKAKLSKANASVYQHV